MKGIARNKRDVLGAESRLRVFDEEFDHDQEGESDEVDEVEETKENQPRKRTLRSNDTPSARKNAKQTPAIQPPRQKRKYTRRKKAEDS